MLKHLTKPPLIKKKNPQLFLFLHGYGGNENDFFSFTTSNELPPYFFFISLRALHNLNDNTGFCWYNINLSNIKIYNISQALKSIKEIIKFISEAILYYDLNKNKIWLCGFSQGAILSYAVAFHYPEIVKNIIILSGFPDKNLLPKTTIKKENYKTLDFFISHGKNDAIIPIELAKTGTILLDNYNINYLYKEYESEHNLNMDNYYDLTKWITKKYVNEF
ncbi:MAG: phospholipase [Candidatus Bostrichicola ureolyticus]|nr:MAG: phospholipase [Candidatus Bostrichicola ureolyticus]